MVTWECADCDWRTEELPRKRSWTLKPLAVDHSTAQQHGVVKIADGKRSEVKRYSGWA